MSDTAKPQKIEVAHSRPAATVIAELHTSQTGLDTEEAGKRLASFGPNRLPEPPKEGFLRRFFKHFHDTLIYILLAAAILTALLGHWVDTGVILGVVLINAIIGFIQEGKAEQALAGLRRMMSLHAHTRRDGEWREIEAEQLVPGDIVRLRSGDRVPADLRIVDANSLRIEESALTGESVPTGKTVEPVAANAGIGDRFCMAFSGTMVAAGRGTGVVVATGPDTELGKINRMIAEVQTLATPLTRQMDQFGRTLSVIVVVMAALMFLAGWALHDFTLDELFLAAIGFAVAAIPEGLPAILTITLAIGVQRMARRNAITRKLNAVETLGSVTVICSDKTGTLTRNEMTAVQLITAAGPYRVEGTGYAPEGGILRQDQPAPLADHPDLLALVEVFALCNDAALVEESGQWRVTGEPTEGALRTLAAKAGFSEQQYQRLAAIPFESENKFMATLHRGPDGAGRILLKGAPDRLLDRCSWQLAADLSRQALDRSFWEEQIEALGAKGLRVLAAAFSQAEETQNTLGLDDIAGEMVFVGLVGIIDPPRPEAIAAIKTCRKAGIRVIMITGDHASTATAIGRDMGIGDGRQALTGDAIESASDEELQDLVNSSDIFARTSPSHKLRLVEALQARQQVVAMTGDGVNDAPALKRADVGIAMGIKGTEVTKGAADIILSDDNFASIERAVEEGRTIYDNLRKAIVFILPTNGAEGLVVLVAVVFGFVLPLTPVQILWVNMITAVTLALALAFEPAEPGLMSRPPRKTGTAILDARFLWRIAFVSGMIGLATIAVFLVERRLGMELALARTLAVNTLVFGQLFYLFNSRFLHESSIGLSRLLANPVAWLMVGVLLLLQLLFVYAPFMHLWFGSASLAARHWLIPIGIGIFVFFAVELEKGLLRRQNRL
jgi:magnesium-transporting ATPase (P-type)